MDYSKHSDGDLLLIFKSGNIQGFNALFNRHWKPLYCLAKRILEDEDLAKDAMQEAFVSLYQDASRKEIVHVASWLFQCVKYQCFMLLRSGKISRKNMQRLHTASSANYVVAHIYAGELEELFLRRIDSLLG